MSELYYGVQYSKSLQHHGVKGQKWGHRRYQYADMSLTPEGREHYGVGKSRGSSSSESGKKGLSKGAKIGIAVGVAAVAAVGIGVAAKQYSSSISAGKAAASLAMKSINTIPINRVQVNRVSVNNLYDGLMSKSISPSSASSGTSSLFGVSYSGSKPKSVSTANTVKKVVTESKSSGNLYDGLMSKSISSSSASSGTSSLFGASYSGSKSTFSSSDMDRLMKNAGKLSDIAKNTTVNNSDVDKFTQDLMKMNMSDLKKMDLW